MNSIEGNTLPEDWEEKKLKEYLNIQNGFAFNSKKFNDNGKGTPLIRIRNLKKSNITTYYDGDYNDKFIVTKGDFLIGMDGEFRCYEWNNENSLLNQRVCRITDVNKNLDSRFLFYGINKFLIDIEAVTAFVTVKHISARQINEINFPVPPLEEQKRIVAKIDGLFTKIDKAITLTEESLVQAKNLLPSVLNEVFEKGKADGWEEKKWDDVLEIKNGKSQKEFLVDEGGYPIYGSGGVMNGRVSKFLCPKNTTIIGRKGTIDKPKYIEEEFWNVDTAFGLCSNIGLSPRFLYYFCLTFNFRSLNKSTTLPSLTKRDLLQIRMPFTTSENQMKVVRIADDILLKSKQTQSKLEEQLAYLKQLKSSILSKAFKGEL